MLLYSTFYTTILYIISFYFFIPYFFLTVSKGQVHEGILHNSDKGSVITWDFDVMRHDVVFTVYRLKIPLSIDTLAQVSSSNQVAADRSTHHQSIKSNSNSSTNANSKVSPQPSPKEPNGAGTKFTFPGKTGTKGEFIFGLYIVIAMHNFHLKVFFLALIVEKL